MLTPPNKTDLGNAIENRNPYSFLNPNVNCQGMTLAADWQLHIEESAYTNAAVNFRGMMRSYEKAFRFPYTYCDAHGNIVKEYIIVAYEGASGE